MSAFNHSDFETSPRKYEMFKTARINGHVFTENGYADLTDGTFVGVRYFCRARNQLRNRVEPVYDVTYNDKFIGQFYASNLSDFCL